MVFTAEPRHSDHGGPETEPGGCQRPGPLALDQLVELTLSEQAENQNRRQIGVAPNDDDVEHQRDEYRGGQETRSEVAQGPLGHLRGEGCGWPRMDRLTGVGHCFQFVARVVRHPRNIQQPETKLGPALPRSGEI